MAVTGGDDDLIGKALAGRYRIISRLGAGGMGVTYRAWYQAAGVPVVIKTPRQHLLSNPTFVERFYREVALLQGMFHPHVVPLMDVGVHDDRPFVVMRFLPGGSLWHRRLRDDKGKFGPNPPEMLHHWLRGIADALDYVHAIGVVHRDVKPANIFFDAFWGAYLGDFGIAKVVGESDVFDKEQTLTGTHMGIGTEPYMAPERFTPRAVIDGRADQYALAVVVYEMLAGRRPFTGETNNLIVEVLTQPAPSLISVRTDLPASLVVAVDRALNKSPGERFVSCADFAAAVLGEIPPPDDTSLARLLCPGCDTMLKLTAADAGRLGSCPRCHAAIVVAPDLGALWLRHEARDVAISLAPPPSPRRAVPDEDDRGGSGHDAPPADAAEPTKEPEQKREHERRIRRSPELRLVWRACVATTLVMAIASAMLAVAKRPPPAKRTIRVITSMAPDVEENFEELEEDQLLENTEQTEVAEMVVASDVAVVEDVKVIGTADDDPFGSRPVNRKDLVDRPVESLPLMDRLSWARPLDSVDGDDVFAGRANAAAMAAANGGGGDTEAAVDRALKWFIEHQLDDGSWSFDLTECPKCKGKCGNSGTYDDRAGATAMALLPFLGRGYTQKEGPYKKQVERGMAFLAARALQQNGMVYSPRSSHGLYVQGLAAIALSECYGMTQDNRLAQPAQLVINHIMAAQDPVGGGWRYHRGQPGDTSAVGWQIMALTSGHVAYLQINPMTIKKAVDFLNSVQGNGGATYGYTDSSDRTDPRSAVGLLCRMHLGWKKGNPALQDGVARLARVGPNNDLYYNYYATQIMYHMEGDVWQAWNARMKPLLLKAQVKGAHEQGSWYAGFEGDANISRYGGRLYCTSLATMICEVYYRHMPMYRNRQVAEEFRE